MRRFVQCANLASAPCVHSLEPASYKLPLATSRELRGGRYNFEMHGGPDMRTRSKGLTEHAKALDEMKTGWY